MKLNSILKFFASVCIIAGAVTTIYFACQAVRCLINGLYVAACAYALVAIMGTAMLSASKEHEDNEEQIQ